MDQGLIGLWKAGWARLARIAAVLAAGGVSVGVALVLSWWLLEPGAIERVSTPALLSVLALAVLPFLTAAAWMLDRAAAVRRAAQPARGGPGPKRTPATSGRRPVARDNAPGRTHERRAGARRPTRPYSGV